MVYRFAECELDERLYQLRREGSLVALEPKVFDVLTYLLHNGDRIVSKDELLDKLWPGQVVGENALTRCIRAARSAVGDDGVKQDIIATQHGRGYRFVAFVTTDSQEEANSSQQEENQKAKVEQTEQEIETERTPPLDGGLRTPDLQDSSSNSPVSSSQPLIPNTQPPIPIRSWSSRSFVLTGVLLLVGIIVIVQYLSQPSLSPQSSFLRRRSLRRCRCRISPRLLSCRSPT